MATQREDAEAVLTGLQARRPVAWLLLRPPRTHHRGPLQVSLHSPVAVAMLGCVLLSQEMVEPWGLLYCSYNRPSFDGR